MKNGFLITLNGILEQVNALTALLSINFCLAEFIAIISICAVSLSFSEIAFLFLLPEVVNSGLPSTPFHRATFRQYSRPKPRGMCEQLCRNLEKIKGAMMAS